MSGFRRGTKGWENCSVGSEASEAKKMGRDCDWLLPLCKHPDEVAFLVRPPRRTGGRFPPTRLLGLAGGAGRLPRRVSPGMAR